MHTLVALAAERAGIIPTFRLRQTGIGPSLIAELVRDGALIRLRQGWYALPGVPIPVSKAVRVGGQLTCHDALRAHGVWVLPDARLHVAVDAHAVRLRDPDDHRRRLDPSDPAVVVHWRRQSDSMTAPLASVREALADLERCATVEAFAVALDSSLHLGLLPRNDELAERYSSRGIDGVCESGIETLLWMRVRSLRRSIRRQVSIPGIGRVDFLVGTRLVIEVDGREHHSTAGAFERDRRRDALLAERGYRVLRFSYHQITREWSLVERTIRAVMADGGHRERRARPARVHK